MRCYVPSWAISKCTLTSLPTKSSRHLTGFTALTDMATLILKTMRV